MTSMMQLIGLVFELFNQVGPQHVIVNGLMIARRASQSVSESHDNSIKLDVDDYDDIDCYTNPVKETNKSQSVPRSLVFASENLNTIFNRVLLVKEERHGWINTREFDVNIVATIDIFSEYKRITSTQHEKSFHLWSN